MNITIDTIVDKPEDMRKAIQLLCHFVSKNSYLSSSYVSNVTSTYSNNSVSSQPSATSAPSGNAFA